MTCELELMGEERKGDELESRSFIPFRWLQFSHVIFIYIIAE
jgi:hypothetical protein